MTMTEPQQDETRDRATSSLLDQMGGTAGFVYSTIPVIVFVTANAFLSLPLTIGIAVATGLALFGYRLLQGRGSARRSAACWASRWRPGSSPGPDRRATSSRSASGPRWPGSSSPPARCWPAGRSPA